MLQNLPLEDIELDLHAQVGSSFIDIGRLLQVGRGGVIPLDQIDTDLISLVAGNIIVAKGVLEIIDQRYVVRIHKVLYHVNDTPAE